MENTKPKGYLIHIKVLFSIIGVLIVLNEYNVTYLTTIPNTAILLLLFLLILAIVRVRPMRERGMQLCNLNSVIGSILFTYLSMFTDTQRLTGFALIINQVTASLFFVALYYSVRTFFNFISWKQRI